jgi:predicted metal-dependent phosphoesterase TrpH
MKYRGSPSVRRASPPPPVAPGGRAIDLHLHSLYSDGTDRPAELARVAKAAGLDVIALADHDSVRGVPEAREACRALGITLVAGIELSVGLGNDEVHILGYGVDAKGRSIQRALDQLAGERLRRMEAMIVALQRLGVAISLEAVRGVAGSEVLGRLHLATALVQKGLAGDRNEAFQRWIGAGRPAYVRLELLSLREAIDLILEAGGVAVMAHPGLTRRDELIEYLVRLGIRGIEVYYPKHTYVDVARYRKTCARFDLFATGGSDYHGAAKPETAIGAARTPPEEFEKLLRFISL